MIVSTKSWRQTFVDNKADSETDEWSTTSRTCGITWGIQRIVLNRERKLVWLTFLLNKVFTRSSKRPALARVF